MSRISQTITSTQAQGKKVLIPYLVAGDPSLELTVPLMHALVASGADIIELGMPFSDPSSDGPIIQQGAERALRAGATLTHIFAMVREFREQDEDTPIVLMGYLNPVEMMGYEAFAAEVKACGADGLLIVDLPTAECEEFFAVVHAQGLDTIFLVAPTTNEARLDSICKHTSGYLYYVSLKGVTGAAITDKGDIRAKIDHLRQITTLPIVVGFGIKDAASARDMAAISDGVIVGSALVDRIGHLKANMNYSNAQLSETVGVIGEIRSAIDAL